MNLPKNSEQLLWVLLSISLHVIVLMLFILTYAQYLPSAGQQQVKIKHAYVYQQQLLQQHKFGNNQPSPTSSSSQSQAVAKQPNILQRRRAIKAQPRLPAKTSAANRAQAASGVKLTQGLSKFLLILHNLIQQHQTYPQVADPAASSNTVKVTFKIYPDGRIRQIAIAKSSGYAVLDEAAVQAVRDISPVKQARQYIKQPLWMAVKVSFLS